MALKTEQSHSTGCELSVEETEWNRLKEFRLKEGFIGGKSVGEESTLQNGFDHGYRKGFEISYPISVIKGLLAVNKLILKENKSGLLTRATEINDSLNDFEKKCSEFKLSCVRFLKERCVASTDDRNDNVDHLLNEIVCPDTGETFNIDKNQLNAINTEFGVLKEEILSFISECQQPLLLEQISQVFGKWECQQLTHSDVYTSEHSDGSASVFCNF